MFIGAGTVTNVITVIIGSGIGLALGNKIPLATKELLTSVLGLFTVVLGIQSLAAFGSTALNTVTLGAATLVILVALLMGTALGSWLKIEERLESLAEVLRSRFANKGEGRLFVTGMVTSTLVFCVGPLTILGALSDGLGRGAEQLMVKSTLDLVTAIAFASSFGIGVLFSAVLVGLFQGMLTLLGYFLGDFLSIAQIDAMTATGGVILLGLALRILQLKALPVADLLPALILSPLFVWVFTLL